MAVKALPESEVSLSASFWCSGPRWHGIDVWCSSGWLVVGSSVGGAFLLRKEKGGFLMGQRRLVVLMLWLILLLLVCEYGPPIVFALASALHQHSRKRKDCSHGTDRYWCVKRFLSWSHCWCLPGNAAGSMAPCTSDEAHCSDLNAWCSVSSLFAHWREH